MLRNTETVSICQSIHDDKFLEGAAVMRGCLSKRASAEYADRITQASFTYQQPDAALVLWPLTSLQKLRVRWASNVIF